jgi:hypothetical protein
MHTKGVSEQALQELLVEGMQLHCVQPFIPDGDLCAWEPLLLLQESTACTAPARCTSIETGHILRKIGTLCNIDNVRYNVSLCASSPGAGINHSEYKRQLYRDCWCKLWMWEMTDYSRLIYLDAGEQEHSINAVFLENAQLHNIRQLWLHPILHQRISAFHLHNCRYGSAAQHRPPLQPPPRLLW